MTTTSKAKDETFFTQLKKLAILLDKQLPALQEQLSNPPDNTAIHQLRATKTIADLRSDVKTIKADVPKETKKGKDDIRFLEQLLTLSKSLVTKSEKQLSTTEEYLKQYGYKPPEPLPEKEEEEENEEERKPSPEDDTTITINEEPVKNVMRTPKLEDRGISKATMDFLRSATKKPPQPSQPRQSERDPLPTSQRNPFDFLPDKFQHHGILVTPSLLGSRKSCDESLVGHALHEALASPVPPILETPGIKQIQSKGDLMFPDPSTRLFDKNPCDSSTFQTSGQAKQIATIAPRQTVEKKAVVGLFQDGAGPRIKSEPGTGQASTMNQTFVKEEPQLPDLTYSLEAISDMTGVYSIVPKMPKAPESLAEKLLQDKQNITPPAPELLSERLSKLAVSKGDNSKVPSNKWQVCAKPPSPKFLSWMNNENKPPK